MRADLPPVGGDVRQDRGALRERLLPHGESEPRMTSRYPAIAADILALFAARGAEPVDVPVHPAGRPVPRHGRRGSAPPHLPHRERDRRRRCASGPNSPSPSASTTSPAAPTRRAAMPISARCFASAARAATNSSRPASRISARPTPPRPTRARSPTRAALLELALPGKPLAVTLGDQAVFEAVLAALGLPRGWQKRLARAFGAPDAAGGGAGRPRAAGRRRRAPPRRSRSGAGGDLATLAAACRDSDGDGRLPDQRRPHAGRDRAAAAGKDRAAPRASAATRRSPR